LTVCDDQTFAGVVTAAFGQRRKMLRNTLRDLIAEADLVALDIRPTARAEELAVADFVRIANHLAR
jgi:16S rRNA (adenine1518-N6/adenine1519-N6)-dimethyltransferase